MGKRMPLPFLSCSWSVCLNTLWTNQTMKGTQVLCRLLLLLLLLTMWGLWPVFCLAVLLLAYMKGNSNLCRAIVRAGARLGVNNNQGINIFNYQVATKQLLFRLLGNFSYSYQRSQRDRWERERSLLLLIVQKLKANCLGYRCCHLVMVTSFAAIVCREATKKWS